jgi:hypothetical protein
MECLEKAYMGMEAAFARITPEELKRFQKNPALAYEQILPDLASIIPDGMGEIAGFADQLEKTFQAQRKTFKNLPDPAVAAKAQAEFEKIASQMLKQAKGHHNSRAKLFSLYKDWHVLHYALTGKSDAGETPIEKSILGGTEFPIPADYGPLRYLTSQEVKEIAKALETVNPDSLISKLDRKDAESKRIYLAHNLDDQEEWSDLPELFDKFRSFYRDAAKNGDAMLLKIV